MCRQGLRRGKTAEQWDNVKLLAAPESSTYRWNIFTFFDVKIFFRKTLGDCVMTKQDSLFLYVVFCICLIWIKCFIKVNKARLFLIQKKQKQKMKSCMLVKGCQNFLFLTFSLLHLLFGLNTLRACEIVLLLLVIHLLLQWGVWGLSCQVYGPKIQWEIITLMSDLLALLCYASLMFYL